MLDFLCSSFPSLFVCLFVFGTYLGSFTLKEINFAMLAYSGVPRAVVFFSCMQGLR